MDLSKLPKLSQTVEAEKQRDVTSEASPVVIEHRLASRDVNSSVMAEVWISVVLGLVFAYLGGTFARFLLTTLSGQTFHTYVNWTDGPKNGSEVAYFELMGYTAWTDASLFLIGIALIADGGMLLLAGSSRKRTWPMGVAISITGVAVSLNLVTAILTFSAGIFPIFSALAVAVGGYMLIQQWQMLRSRGA